MNRYEKISVFDGEYTFDKDPEQYCAPMITITKIVKIGQNSFIRFSMWDDIEINAFSALNTESLRFIFKENDPLYSPLCSLLNNERILIIDDDNTIDSKQKFALITKHDNFIAIDIKGDINAERRYDRYKIFIKNILYDGRSKSSNNIIKEKLVNFFKDAEISLNSTMNKNYELEYNPEKGI